MYVIIMRIPTYMDVGVQKKSENICLAGANDRYFRIYIICVCVRIYADKKYGSGKFLKIKVIITYLTSIV